jgi:hypothetical protein
MSHHHVLWPPDSRKSQGQKRVPVDIRRDQDTDADRTLMKGGLTIPDHAASTKNAFLHSFTPVVTG